MKKLLLPLLLTFLGMQLAFAQQTNKRIALVIGNAAYKTAVLRNPVNDANLMERTLKQLEFKVIKVTNASKSQMQSAIDKFKLQLAHYDVSLFYYAGHGMEINGRNYLIPVDARNTDEKTVRINSIDVGSVVREFENYAKNTNIVILDACRDNPFVAVSRGSNRGFKAMASPSGSLIAFATAPGETAADGTGNNGLYTSVLVTEMLKPQRIEDVFINTRNRVTRKNRSQIPQEWSQLRSKFFFSKAANSTKSEPEVGGLTTGNVVYQYGNIRIDTEIGGSLYLNDKYMGELSTNSKGNLLSKQVVGKYRISIDGKENYTAKVDVNKDQTTRLHIRSDRKNHDISDHFTDSRDGKVYKTIIIDTQTWMAENLAFRPYSGNYWAYDKDKNNTDRYGYLYDWGTAQKVCLTGWHLPTDSEWEQLVEFIASQIPNLSKVDEDWEGMAKYLKFSSNWKKGDNGNDKFGFSALPGGFRSASGFFYYRDFSARWWSASTNTRRKAAYRYLDSNDEDFYRQWSDYNSGFSVRCVRD